MVDLASISRLALLVLVVVVGMPALWIALMISLAGNIVFAAGLAILVGHIAYMLLALTIGQPFNRKRRSRALEEKLRNRRMLAIVVEAAVAVFMIAIRIGSVGPTTSTTQQSPLVGAPWPLLPVGVALFVVVVFAALRSRANLTVTVTVTALLSLSLSMVGAGLTATIKPNLGSLFSLIHSPQSTTTPSPTENDVEPAQTVPAVAVPTQTSAPVTAIAAPQTKPAEPTAPSASAGLGRG
jgi:hypothetical protein